MATADNRRGLARRRLLAFGAMTAVCLSSAAAAAHAATNPSAADLAAARKGYGLQSERDGNGGAAVDVTA